MGNPRTGNGSKASGKKLSAKDIIYMVFTKGPKGTGAINGRRPNHHFIGKGKAK